MNNIPIYRAKKINSDEYVEGYYYKDGRDHIIFNGDSTTIFGLRVIDPSTLAIHFPDMIDSQGNKIFVSLQEDGKGGDILGSLRIKFCQEDFIFKIQPIGYNYWNKINSSIFYFFEHSIITGIQE